MFIDGQDFWLAFGLMLFMEGMLYALLPRDMLYRLFRAILETPLQHIRMAAVIVATIGVFIMWYIMSNTMVK